MASQDAAVVHNSLPQMVSQSDNRRVAMSKHQPNDDNTVKLLPSNCINNGHVSPDIIEIDSRSNSPLLEKGNVVSVAETADVADLKNRVADGTSEVADSNNTDALSNGRETNQSEENLSNGVDQGIGLQKQRSTKKAKGSARRQTASNKERKNPISNGNHNEKSDDILVIDSGIPPNTKEETDDKHMANDEGSLDKISTSAKSIKTDSSKEAESNNANSNKSSPNSKKLDDVLQKISPAKNGNTADSPVTSESKQENENGLSSSSEKSSEGSSRRTPRKQDNPLKRYRGEDASPEVSPKVRRKILNDEGCVDTPSDEQNENENTKSSRYGRVQRQRSMGPDMKLLPIVNRHKPRSKESSPKTPRITFTPKKVIGAGDYVKRLLRDLMLEIDDPIPGDLFWSRIPGHPYWPCMVALDPIKGQYRKELSQRNRKGTVYHVQYFGKDTQRGWTVPDGMIPFRGQKRFEKLIQDLTEKTPDGPDKDFLAFIFKINPNRIANLNIAIEEAEEAYGMSRSERNKELTFEYKMPSGESFIPICEDINFSNLKTSESLLKQPSSNSIKLSGYDPVKQGNSTSARKRGRPKKSTLTETSNSTLDVESNGVSSSLNTPSKDSAPMSKGRGRPRKPVSTPVSSAETLPNNEISKESSAKAAKKTLGIKLTVGKSKGNTSTTSKMANISPSANASTQNGSAKITDFYCSQTRNPEPGVGSSVTPVDRTVTARAGRKRKVSQSVSPESDISSSKEGDVQNLKDNLKEQPSISALTKASTKPKSVDKGDETKEGEHNANMPKTDLNDSQEMATSSTDSSMLDSSKSNEMDDSDDIEVVYANIKPKRKKRRRRKITENADESPSKNDVGSNPSPVTKPDGQAISVAGEKTNNAQVLNETSINKMNSSVGNMCNYDSSGAGTPLLLSADSDSESSEKAKRENRNKANLLTETVTRNLNNLVNGNNKEPLNQNGNVQDLNGTDPAFSPRRSRRAHKPKTPPDDFVDGQRKSKTSPSITSPIGNKAVRQLNLDGKDSVPEKTLSSKDEKTESNDYVPEDDDSVSPSRKQKTAQKSKGSFAVFVEQHINQYRRQNPSFSEKELEAYMFHDWENLPEHMKNTFVLHFSNTTKKPILPPVHPSTGKAPRKSVRTEKADHISNNKSSDDADTESEETESTCSAQGHDGVCVKCEKTGDLVACGAECQQLFHTQCLEGSKKPGARQICSECASGKHHCFKCKSQDGDILKCPIASCGKFYHVACLQACTVGVKGDTKSSNKGCPLHSCLTCNLNNPKGVSLRRARLKRCVRCPVAYHSGDGCLAAGCQSLSRFCIICPNHFAPRKGNPYHTHVSVNWCFSCSLGGQLVCCESCPAAYHPECLDIEPPEGSFFCEDCSAGKHPCYGDIVWVKLGSYRWWPAEICQPSNVPQNIQNLPHTVGQFPVRFFGSHDYFWIHRGRVFLFQEGDKGSKYETSRHLAQVFQKAVTEATEAFQTLTSAKVAYETQSKSKKPVGYKDIKTNRPVGKVQLHTLDESSLTVCECDPSKPNPCGIDSQCLNRVLMIECSPAVCPAGERCQNQMFIKRQNAPAVPVSVENRGWGLNALEDIKKGTFVAEYVGELIDEEECQRRLKIKHEENDSNFYFLTLDKDRIIDAGPKGNMSRFMNHSCKPNCESQKWTVNGDTRVGLFAISDIPAGSELTFNYNLDCYGNEKTKCACGSDNCSGYIGVRPKTLAAMVQEKRAKECKENVKKRRRSKNQQTPKHEDECFRCGEGGELMMCDRKSCTKAYHLNCLSLEKPPHGRWECPWHHCDICGRSSTLLCVQCPNSYCKEHGSKDNIVQFADNLWQCTEHSDEFMDKANGKDTVQNELKS